MTPPPVDPEQWPEPRLLERDERPDRDLTPERKVAATGVTGAATVVLLYILHRFGVDVPQDVAAAGALLLSVGVGYLVPSRRPRPPA